MANGEASGLFGAVQAQLDQLSPRDRKLLAGLLSFFGLLFVGFVALTLRGRLEDKASRVVAAKSTLEAMQELQKEYVVGSKRVDQATERLKQFNNKPLSAYVEETARKVQASDQLSVSKQQSENQSGFEQTKYKVDLRRVPLDAGLQIIYDLETSGYPLKVDSAEFRTIRIKDEVMVHLTLEITAYSLAEGGG